MSRERQHWLPKAYLRPFRSGQNDTLYMLDLYDDEPVWRHVGFNDVCNTRRYHSNASIDKHIDRTVVERYATVAGKIVSLRETVDVGEALSEAETEALWLFASVHLRRNPQFRYRWYHNLLREYVLIHPRRRLPRWLWSELPRLGDAVEALREAERHVGHLVSRFEREAVILATVHRFVGEDFNEYGRLPIPTDFEKQMLRVATWPESWSFGVMKIVYSEQAMFTVDNPFVVSRFPAGELTMTLPLSPHHLLLGIPSVPGDFDPMLATALLPYSSFSTKILAREPMDLALVRINPLPHEIDPSFRDADFDISQLAVTFIRDARVIERQFGTRDERNSAN